MTYHVEKSVTGEERSIQLLNLSIGKSMFSQYQIISGCTILKEECKNAHLDVCMQEVH